jgi:hypothetical protein
VNRRTHLGSHPRDLGTLEDGRKKERGGLWKEKRKERKKKKKEKKNYERYL